MGRITCRPNMNFLSQFDKVMVIMKIIVVECLLCVRHIVE